MKGIVGVLLLVVVLVSCGGEETVVESKKWNSLDGSCSIAYAKKWTKLYKQDPQNANILFGLIDTLDGTSYTLTATQDTPKSEVSDSLYLTSLKRQMLRQNQGNELLLSNKENFKGRKFNHLVFSMNTDKWGELIQHIYILRTGKKMYGIQTSFPADENNNIDEIPTKVQELMEGTVIHFE